MVPDGLAADFLPDAQEVCSYVRVSHNQVSTITRDLLHSLICKAAIFSIMITTAGPSYTNHIQA